MRVLLLGATGRLGSQILKELNDKGIETSVLVRNPDRVKVKSEHIRVSKGDVTNINDLGIAMEECDVIISALNISRKSDFPWSKLRTPETLMSDVMKILVNTAGKNNIQKIVTVSAWGANDSEKDLPAWFRWVINNSNVKYGYQDHERQENILMNSKIDWTIVRPVGLSNSQSSKKANISTESVTSGIMVGRRSVAMFIVENITNDEFNNKVVTIS